MPVGKKVVVKRPRTIVYEKDSQKLAEAFQKKNFDEVKKEFEALAPDVAQREAMMRDFYQMNQAELENLGYTFGALVQSGTSKGLLKRAKDIFDVMDKNQIIFQDVKAYKPYKASILDKFELLKQNLEAEKANPENFKGLMANFLSESGLKKDVDELIYDIAYNPDDVKALEAKEQLQKVMDLYLEKQNPVDIVEQAINTLNDKGQSHLNRIIPVLKRYAEYRDEKRGVVAELFDKFNKAEGGQVMNVIMGADEDKAREMKLKLIEFFNKSGKPAYSSPTTFYTHFYSDKVKLVQEEDEEQEIVMGVGSDAGAAAAGVGNVGGAGASGLKVDIAKGNDNPIVKNLGAGQNKPVGAVDVQLQNQADLEEKEDDEAEKARKEELRKKAFEEMMAEGENFEKKRKLPDMKGFKQYANLRTFEKQLTSEQDALVGNRRQIGLDGWYSSQAKADVILPDAEEKKVSLKRFSDFRWKTSNENSALGDRSSLKKIKDAEQIMKYGFNTLNIQTELPMTNLEKMARATKPAYRKVAPYQLLPNQRIPEMIMMPYSEYGLTHSNKPIRTVVLTRDMFDAFYANGNSERDLRVPANYGMVPTNPEKHRVKPMNNPLMYPDICQDIAGQLFVC